MSSTLSYKRRPRVLICGSRNWPEPLTIKRRVLALAENTIIIAGKASGADRIAARFARARGMEVIELPAQWQRHGKRAGYLRNVEMLEMGPKLVIAFQHNGSRGTQHTINEARKRKIPVEVVKPFGGTS